VKHCEKPGGRLRCGSQRKWARGTLEGVGLPGKGLGLDLKVHTCTTGGLNACVCASL
jgi:hypothetical protein